MPKVLLILSTILGLTFSNLLYSQNDSTINAKIKEIRANSRKLSLTKLIPRDSIWDRFTLEQKWIILVDSVGGCLTSGEYCTNGECGGEGCCLKFGYFAYYLRNESRKELAYFLINKLPDQSISKVHTCPYQNATHGELATYCLQYLFKKNWYDLSKEYKKYTDGTLEYKKDFYSLQEVLQDLLRNSNERKKMISYWTELNEK